VAPTLNRSPGVVLAPLVAKKSKDDHDHGSEPILAVPDGPFRAGLRFLALRGLEWTFGERHFGMIHAPKVATGLSPGLNGAKLRRITAGFAPKGLEDSAQGFNRVETLG
jgi:hypothetical protein